MFLSAVLRLGSLRIRPGLVGLVLELELGFGLLSALVYLVPLKSLMPAFILMLEMPIYFVSSALQANNSCH